MCGTKNVPDTENACVVRGWKKAQHTVHSEEQTVQADLTRDATQCA